MFQCANGILYIELYKITCIYTIHNCHPKLTFIRSKSKIGAICNLTNRLVNRVLFVYFICSIELKRVVVRVDTPTDRPCIVEWNKLYQRRFGSAFCIDLSSKVEPFRFFVISIVYQTDLLFCACVEYFCITSVTACPTKCFFVPQLYVSKLGRYVHLYVHVYYVLCLRARMYMFYSALDPHVHSTRCMPFHCCCCFVLSFQIYGFASPPIRHNVAASIRESLWAWCACVYAFDKRITANLEPRRTFIYMQKMWPFPNWNDLFWFISLQCISDKR